MQLLTCMHPFLKSALHSLEDILQSRAFYTCVKEGRRVLRLSTHVQELVSRKKAYEKGGNRMLQEYMCIIFTPV